MKKYVPVLAFAAFWLTSPAGATTISYTGNTAVNNHAPAFDTSLGSLYKVTLELDAQIRRLVDVRFTDSSATPVHIDWDMNGFNQLFVTRTGTTAIPVAGNGSVDAIPSGLFNVVTVPTLATGHLSLELDPAAFLVKSDGSSSIVAFGSADPNFFNPEADTTFTANAPIAKILGAGSYSDDLNRLVTFKLTYDYVAGGTPGVVPEPATWVLMLTGFGGIGYSLRRRLSGNSPSTSSDF